MRLSVLMALCAGFMIILNGCSSNSSSALVESSGSTETTGYWYLGDNGQRQWRSFTTDANNDEKSNNTFSKGISPFGNGSGR